MFFSKGYVCNYKEKNLFSLETNVPFKQILLAIFTQSKQLPR